MPASLGLAPVGVDDGDAGQGLGRFGVFSLRLRRHLGSVEAGVGRTIEMNRSAGIDFKWSTWRNSRTELPQWIEQRES